MKNLLIYSDLRKMDTESKIKEIKKWVDRIRDKYIDIPSESVDLVYDFLILNKPTEVEVPGIVAYYYGLYYDGDKNPEKLLKYYLIGVESGVAASMHNLGNYYRRIGDAANTEKYYKMGIDNGNGHSIHELFDYYRCSENYTAAVEYCLTLIERKIPYSHGHMRMLLYWKKLKESDLIKLMDITDYETYSSIVGERNELLLLYKLYKIKIDYIEAALKFSPDWEGLKLAREDFAQQVINFENLSK